MEKDRIQTLGDVLTNYLDPQLVSLIMNDRNRRDVSGVEYEAAVLFVDIRHFNSVCEKISPTKVAQLLSAFQEYSMEIIHRFGGIVDKMMGDCTMGYWLNMMEEPEEDTVLDRLKKNSYEMSAEKTIKGALRAAHAMNRDIEKLEKKTVSICGYAVEIAIGIHYGPVFFGNIGSSTRKDFTIVGNTVNVAAKLKEMAPAGKIYLTEGAMSHINSEFTFSTVLNNDEEWNRIFCREGEMGVYELVQRAARVSVDQLQENQNKLD